jgi:hypothetical protein
MKKEEAECYLDFWTSFQVAVSHAGGVSNINTWRKHTLEELALMLSQNGIRFYFDPKGVLKN